MTRILTIPGMVDPHVHLRDLDWAHKATFESETRAALAGGYWAVLDMPNTAPATVSASALAAKLARIQASALCDWGVYFGASQDDNTAQYAQVIGRVCGLKIYNNATTGNLLIDNQDLRREHYRAWSQSRPIAVHAEGQTVADILALVREFGTPTHFCHISTAYEIALLRDAKLLGLPISVGVTPHHLWLTEDDVARLGSYGRMKPELKTRADVDALWYALDDATVDVIESDHAPHTIAEKESAAPPFGVPGLETTLPLLCTALHEGRLSEQRLIDLVARNPQRIFGLTPPDGTYTLVDLDAEHTITRDNLFTRCGWSPFEGMRVRGKVREVWIRGRKVFDSGRVLVEPGSGRGLFETQGSV